MYRWAVGYWLPFALPRNDNMHPVVYENEFVEVEQFNNSRSAAAYASWLNGGGHP